MKDAYVRQSVERITKKVYIFENVNYTSVCSGLEVTLLVGRCTRRLSAFRRHYEAPS